MDEARRIADEARDSLGPYCMDVCKALCCRKGAILLQGRREINAVTRGEDVQDRIKVLPSGMHALSVEPKACPKLDERNMCTIYTQRPRACKDFPLFFAKKNLITASVCPAVQKGMLDGYIRRIQALGYTIL